MDEIPIVDFWNCGLNVEEISDENCTTTGQAIYQAFANIGFVYLKNTGITREHVDEIDSTMDKFYELDTPTKEIYARDENSFGYIGINVERMNGKANFTTLRSLHYPPIPNNVALKPGQLRLGEHCDYGSFTLIFQDNVGGLQVESYDGKFMEAVLIPDTVLVNIGDILQFWTDGRLKSTKHRVMIPDIQSARNVDRKSLAYFVHPDHEVVLSGIEYGASCLDHHERIEPEYEEPVTAFEHVNIIIGLKTVTSIKNLLSFAELNKMHATEFSCDC
ncbi:uncharacterized protein LOC120339035 [Styela clava]